MRNIIYIIDVIDRRFVVSLPHAPHDKTKKMPQEQFFGLPVPVSASPVKMSLRGKALHVTQVAGVNFKGKLRLEVATGRNEGIKFVLAVLTENNPQCVLDATFFENDKSVVFYATGSGSKGSKGASLHLTGVVVTSDETEEDQEEEEEENDAEIEGFRMGESQEMFPSDQADSDSDEADDDWVPLKSAQRKRSSSSENKKRKLEDSSESSSSEEEYVETPKQKKRKKKKSRSNSNGGGEWDDDFQVRKSGLKLKVVKQGHGKSSMSGKKVRIKYRAMLRDGTEFDSSKPDEPLHFRLGTQAIIQGVDEACVGMKVGEVRKVVVPPELGYGDEGIDGVIPPNATLKFEIERV